MERLINNEGVGVLPLNNFGGLVVEPLEDTVRVQEDYGTTISDIKEVGLEYWSYEELKNTWMDREDFIDIYGEDGVADGFIYKGEQYLFIDIMRA